MRIDGSGNVGIGESSPDTTLHIDSNGATTTLKISSNTESSVEFDDKGGSAKRYKIGTNISSNDGQLEFKDMTANAERMRIDSSGTLLHGKTSNNINHSGTQIERNGSGGTVAVTQSGNGVNSLILNNRYGSGTQYPLSFRYSGTEVGFVGITSSATSYNTSSDYRLKENVVDLDGAIPRLKTLPVHRFNFIADSETTVDGFLAHEAQLVVPEAVTGTHNEVDGDGNPVMQAIDQSKLVPLLTAALQEAIGRIETLETEVAALKAG
jgi:hemin uptake protein HemP